MHLFKNFRIFVLIKAIATKTKVTLTIDQHIKEKAKKYAEDSGRSLSEIIENYLEAITSGGIKSESKETPVVKSLKGSFKAPAEFGIKMI